MVGLEVGAGPTRAAAFVPSVAQEQALSFAALPGNVIRAAAVQGVGASGERMRGQHGKERKIEQVKVWRFFKLLI